MSKHHLRNDHSCQNCGNTVDKRFCAACGQENVETRQSFGHLVRHFAEDLTHYESNFWKTIKYLLLRPAYLTKTYLAGKRMIYVAPVKLYIFISFIAFFLPGILPDFNKGKSRAEAPSVSVGRKMQEVGQQMEKYGDSLSRTNKHTQQVYGDDQLSVRTSWGDYNSVEEYDSVQRTLPPSRRDGYVARMFNKKSISYQHKDPEEVKKQLWESFTHNFPKALFVFMPLFAFVIWLFHGKKRWLYFDHAIFTLHYFSFILLVFTLRSVLMQLIPWYFIAAPGVASLVSAVLLWGWVLYYFYRAHHKAYGEIAVVSWIKSGCIFLINLVIFFAVLVAFVMITFLTIH